MLLRELFTFGGIVMVDYSNCIFNNMLGSIEFEKQLLQLRQTTGTILRFDHTYKFVKCLGAYSTQMEKWVHILISILI